MSRILLASIMILILASWAQAADPVVTHQQIAPGRARVVIEYDAADLDADLPELVTLPSATAETAYPGLLVLRVAAGTEAYLIAAEAAIKAEYARAGIPMPTRAELLRARLADLLRRAYEQAEAAARSRLTLTPEQVAAQVASQ